VHPATRKNAKLRRHLRKRLPTNAIFSQKSLVQDLEESLCCVYRSSASAIEALAFGVNPVHFQSSNEFDLDPIFNAHLEHPRAHDYSHLERIIEGLADSCVPSFSSKRRMQKYFKDYYSPLKIEALE
jgi:hypothetical protein